MLLLAAKRLLLEQRIAFKFMAENPMQTLLISIAIAVGTGVIIFITSLMYGLQQNTIQKTLGSQAHLSLEAAKEINLRPQLNATSHQLVLESQRSQPLRRINNWQAVQAELDRLPQLLAVSPSVAGGILVQRGKASASVTLSGVDADRLQKIVNLQASLISGSYVISSQDALLGSELAQDLGLVVGDKLRLVASNGASALVKVAGIYRLGLQELDSRRVYVDLKLAQSLLNLQGGVTLLEMKIDDVFLAKQEAQRLARLTGLQEKNWMDNNSQLLDALKSQTMTTAMIRGFIALAVGLGIASVMAVNVVQRTREIGILRAMGASKGQILRVFLFQGGYLGVLGAFAGVGLSYLLVGLFNGFVKRMFFVTIQPEVMLTAVLLAVVAGVLAAALPARRAALYRPAEAIRYV